jgi:predicted class III extradiol MEMO1 family dioxygenase
MQPTQNGQLVKKGKQLYETKLRKLLEPEHKGEYVAIEPDSGDYYLGHTMSEAYDKAIEEHPDKHFFLARVGYKAAVSFKHRTAL